MRSVSAADPATAWAAAAWAIVHAPEVD